MYIKYDKEAIGCVKNLIEGNAADKAKGSDS